MIACNTHKEYEPHEWRFYGCWLFLKTHRAFLPPSSVEDQPRLQAAAVPAAAAAATNNSDPSSNENSDNAGDEDSPDPRALFSTPGATPALRDQSRGPGYGSKKTKSKGEDDEYRNKKTKIQEGFLQVQKERQADFRMYVNNQARQQAFKMAVLGYNTFKDDDPVEAARYKASMTNIISRNTAADEENPMPGLGGNSMEDV